MIATATIATQLFIGYALVGAVFGVFFILRGVGKLDVNAAHGTWGFRLIILPGVATFWPWLLLRWLRGRPQPLEKTAHRQRAKDRTSPGQRPSEKTSAETASGKTP